MNDQASDKSGEPRPSMRVSAMQALLLFTQQADYLEGRNLDLDQTTHLSHMWSGQCYSGYELYTV